MKVKYTQVMYNRK